MKSLKGITRDCKKTFNLLKSLSKEVGAYAVNTSWIFDGKLELQCSTERLRMWMEENNLEFNTLHHGEPAYETEDFILFVI